MVTSMSDQELKVVLAGIEASLKRLEEKLDAVTDDTKALKQAVWNPKDGLYALTAKQEAELTSMKSQLSSYSKALWIAGSTVIGLVAKAIIELL